MATGGGGRGAVGKALAVEAGGPLGDAEPGGDGAVVGKITPGELVGAFAGGGS